MNWFIPGVACGEEQIPDKQNEERIEAPFNASNGFQAGLPNGFVCKLDKKFRLVLPMEIRDYLEIGKKEAVELAILEWKLKGDGRILLEARKPRGMGEAIEETENRCERKLKRESKNGWVVFME